MNCPTCNTYMEKTADSKEMIGYPPSPRFSDYACEKCPKTWRHDRQTGTLIALPENPAPVPQLDPTPWDQLGAREKRRVEDLIGALSEFEAAIHHSGNMGRALPIPNHPLNRFMANAFATYLDGFYGGSAYGVLDVLRSINLPQIANAVDQMLEAKVGELTNAQDLHF